jgi:beta-mannosidase
MQEWRATASDGRETELSLPGVPPSFAGSETVEYRTTLSDPRDPGEDIAVLTLRGVYARATVELSGRLDGDSPVEHDIYFRPLRVPFKPDRETEITVTCHAPDDRFGGVHDTDSVPDEQTVPGVWWDASLDTGPLPYLESVAVQPEPGPELRVRTSVLTGGPCSKALTYSVRPAGRSRGGGTMERTRLDVGTAGRTTVEHTLPLRNPAPWWPRGFGDQNRQVLRVTLGDQERTATAGIRDVTIENGSLRVNGERVPVRGVNLVDGTVADVERALEVNATLVRAHAHVPPAAVYDACDEAGLLVWQDLPLTGPGEFNVDRGRELAGALARQTAQHPSVAVFAAHDDPITVATGLGDGLLDRLRLRWRAWRASYDATPARALADALPEPSYPAVGGPGLDCDAGAYYPGWHYGTPGDIDRLLARYPATVVAEFGAPAPDHDGEGEQAATPAFTGPVSETDHAAAARTGQAGLVGTVSERLRRERVGAVAFCLRDTGTNEFGVYGVDGEPKPARDALARAFEPVQAFLVDPSTGTNRVVVVNDTTRSVSATLRWRAGDAGDSLNVAVDGRGTWSGGPVEIPADAETVTLELVGDDLRVENAYALSTGATV